MLEDFIDNFVAKQKQLSHHIISMVCSSDDMDEEELSESHKYVLVQIPKLDDPPFEMIVDYLITRERRVEWKTLSTNWYYH